MEKYFALLGRNVIDRVTKVSGVVTAISFDLYGCVQCIVNPGINEKDGKAGELLWFDHKRLVTTDPNPVMAVPNFSAPGNENGPEAKPLPQRG